MSEGATQAQRVEAGDCDNTSWSFKKNRLYCRLFNHQTARDLRAQGLSYAAIARELGVTHNAVIHACDPEQRRKSYERGVEWTRENMRAPCKGGCGARIWTNNRDFTGYCPSCSGLLRATSVAPDTLRCGRCGEWKPDDDFPSHKASKARRGRHSVCRPCQTEARREYRERHKVPCDDCGAPCLPAGEKGSRGCRDTGLCADCYRASMSARA